MRFSKEKFLTSYVHVRTSFCYLLSVYVYE